MAEPAAAQKIDRTTTTPFLLKLFYKQNSWHRLEDFDPERTLPQHLQIYTWPSCSLRELSHLLTSALPSVLPSPAAGTRLAYRLIYPDAKGLPRDPSLPGRFLSKELGSVVVGSEDTTMNGTTNGTGAAAFEGDSEKTLQEARFIIGDYVSCVILPPQSDGSVAPTPMPPPVPSRGGYGGPPRGGYPPREDGYSFRGRGPRADFGGGGRGPNVPPGEWRRGERLPDRGYGGGGYRGRGGRGRGW